MMASPVTTPGMMSSQVQPTLRLPKLSYRKKHSDTESVNTMSTETSRISTSTNIPSPLQSTFCPSPRETPTKFSSHTSLRSPSIVSSSVAPKTFKHPPKKRPSFFSGLFSAKEPSAQAFAEYEKRLLKQGRGRASTKALPGVSTAKLPPSVPKVNSKWDGIPQMQREKEDLNGLSITGQNQGPGTTRSAGSDSRSQYTTTSQKRLSRGTLGGVSTHSSSSANRLADLYGWEINSNPVSSSSSAVVDFAAEHRPSTSRLQTSHSAPAPTQRPPPLDTTSLFPAYVSSPYSMNSPSHIEPSTPNGPYSPNVPSHSYSPALTPSDSSPVTPDSISPKTNFVFPQSECGSSGNFKTTVLEAPVRLDEVIIKSTGSNVLGPPATAKRRAKVIPREPGDDRPKTSGSDMPLSSILKDTTQDTPPRPRTGSYFPSSDSASPNIPRRQNSARERLGLGMNLKTQAIAPWSSLDNAKDATTGDVTTTPTQEGGQSIGRKRRKSIFRK